MDKQIHLLYSCDEWKTRDSMRLVMGSVSKDKIKKQLIKEIKDENMEYDSDMSDIRDSSFHMVNINLRYGYVEVINDGELQ